MNVMILGAAGDIGRHLLEHYLAKPEVQCIFATHHREVSSICSSVRWLTVDMADPDSIENQAAAIDVPIHRWICCTGLLAGPHGQPEKTLRRLASNKLQHDYAVNAVGPLTLFAQLARQLRSDDLRAVFLSAQVGSIEDNRLGGWYGYRMSKAALNMGVRCLAIECGRWRSRPTIVAVHPGTTASNLSRPFTKSRTTPVQSPEQCAARLYELVEALAPEQTGQFLKLSGEILPW
jgi:NAD(P)-dependent dehydrogenase (short-subunit alcohol dehydrogenase family)